jgi:hypothetical protein
MRLLNPGDEPTNMKRRSQVNEESSVTQPSQTGQTSIREFRLPGRKDIEDWLKEIRTVSSGILDELRGVAAGEESLERRRSESLDERGNSEHRLAVLKQRLTERLQETSDGGEAAPAGESDQRHPVSE